VKKAKEAKLIVTRELSLAAVKEVRQTLPAKTPLLLQPQSNLNWSLDKGHQLLEETLSGGLKNIRLSIQLHKIYNIR
jgi:organic radical activating enzyme